MPPRPAAPAALALALLVLLPDQAASFAASEPGRGLRRPRPASSSSRCAAAEAATPISGPAGPPGEEPPQIRIRRALPAEIDALSALVADCFVPPVQDGAAPGGSAEEEAAALAAARRRIDRSVARWTVYGGMAKRLVMESYREGLREVREERGSGRVPNRDAGAGAGAGPGEVRPLFVAELLPPPGKGTAPAAATLVGVAELAREACPVPFDRAHRPDAAMVCNLCVLPGYRRLGLGRRLLRRLEQEAEGEEAEIWLWTGLDNTAALAMYEEEGYVMEGMDPPARGSGRRAYLRKILRAGMEQEQGQTPPPPPYGKTMVGDETWIEARFGPAAPLMAGVAAVVGFVLF